MGGRERLSHSRMETRVETAKMPEKVITGQGPRDGGRGQGLGRRHLLRQPPVPDLHPLRRHLNLKQKQDSPQEQLPHPRVQHRPNRGVPHR